MSFSLENVKKKSGKRTEYENMLNEIEIEQNKLISITKELGLLLKKPLKMQQ